MSVNYALVVLQAEITPLGLALVCAGLGAMTHAFFNRNGGGRGR